MCSPPFSGLGILGCVPQFVGPYSTVQDRTASLGHFVKEKIFFIKNSPAIRSYTVLYTVMYGALHSCTVLYSPVWCCTVLQTGAHTPEYPGPLFPSFLLSFIIALSLFMFCLLSFGHSPSHVYFGHCPSRIFWALPSLWVLAIACYACSSSLKN